MNIWWQAIRPKTLTAAFVPVICATALAQFAGVNFNAVIVICCLVSATFIQIATNLFNDVIDFKKGADTAERLGPVRITQKGLVSEAMVWFAAIFCLAGAVVFGIPLIISGGWPIVAIGLISLVMAYAYTGGPLPLAYLGLGDLFVILFFGLVAVGGVYFLLTENWDLDALILGLQVGLLATSLLAINNLRDVHQDRAANKRTVAVRFGEAFAKKEITLVIMAPFVLQIYWYVRGGLWPSLLPLILLPMAWRLVAEVQRTPPSIVLNEHLAKSARLHGGFGILISVGLWVG